MIIKEESEKERERRGSERERDRWGSGVREKDEESMRIGKERKSP